MTPPAAPAAKLIAFFLNLLPPRLLIKKKFNKPILDRKILCAYGLAIEPP